MGHGACWRVRGCLWRMCGWMRLKLCGNVIEIHGKAMQVLQGCLSLLGTASSPASLPATPPHLPPRAICQLDISYYSLRL